MLRCVLCGHIQGDPKGCDKPMYEREREDEVTFTAPAVNRLNHR